MKSKKPKAKPVRKSLPSRLKKDDPISTIITVRLVVSGNSYTSRMSLVLKHTVVECLEWVMIGGDRCSVASVGYDPSVGIMVELEDMPFFSIREVDEEAIFMQQLGWVSGYGITRTGYPTTRRDQQG